MSSIVLTRTVINSILVEDSAADILYLSSLVLELAAVEPPKLRSRQRFNYLYEHERSEQTTGE